MKPPTNPPSPGQPDTPLALATISPSGKPPRQRLADAAQAQQFFETLREASLPRLAKAAIVQGCFDGNPPYNPTKLRNAAQGWRSNFNSLEAASMLESAKAPYYDLFSSSALLADCATDEPGEQADASAATRFRSQCFHDMLQTFPGFYTEFWAMLSDFIAFNKGFLWFPKPDSWHFERIPWNRIYFPDGTTVQPDKWEVFAIQHTWPVHKLYGWVKDEEAARQAGWNVGQVWEAIRRASPDDEGRNGDDPMKVQQSLRDHELAYSARCSTVQAASIYVREFDGKWSRMVVEIEHGVDERTPGKPRSPIEADQEKQERAKPKLKPEGWLFNKPSVAESLYEIMIPFIFEVGDGMINTLAGLGPKIISLCQAKDRVHNQMLDNAMQRSTIVLQAQTGGGQQKLATVNIGGGVTHIPSGYAVQPGTIFGDIEGALVVSQDLDNRLQRNTGVYRPTFEKPTGNPESATAAQIRFSQATILGNSAVQRFQQQLDPLYHEIYARASDMSLPRTSRDPAIRAAIEFQRKLENYGLTKKQIEDNQRGLVTAVRAIGNGSSVKRQQDLAALGQIVPYMGPRGLVNWKVDYAAAFAGPRGALRYFPPEDLNQIPTREDWDAVSENNDMQTGAPVLFLESQDHEAHAKIHLTAAAGAVQSVVQGGADPAMPFTFLQIAMPHIGQHISKVPREQVRDALEKAYAEVAAGAKQVFAAAEQQAKQKGQQQQMSFEQQLQAQELAHKQQMAEAKSQGMLQLKAQRQQADMEMARQKQLQDRALADSKTASEITRQSVSTASEIERQNAATAAQLENDRLKAEAQAEAIRNKPKPESK